MRGQEHLDLEQLQAILESFDSHARALTTAARNSSCRATMRISVRGTVKGFLNKLCNFPEVVELTGRQDHGESSRRV